MRIRNPKFRLLLNISGRNRTKPGKTFHNFGIRSYFKKQPYCLFQILLRLFNCFPLTCYFQLFATRYVPVTLSPD